MNDEVLALQARMADAIAAEDYELAARIRDELVALGGPEALIGPGSKLRREQPGKMGLGTDQQSYAPPKGWVAPKRPSPSTANHRGRRTTKD